MRGAVIAVTGIVAVAASATPLPAARAASDLSRYQGAWLEQNSSCEPIFSRGGRGVAFKAPVSPFIPAFIISGNRLRTPSATCRIKGLKPAGGRETLLLNCATSVAASDVAVLMAPSEGSLKRFTSAEDDVGMTYKRCQP